MIPVVSRSSRYFPVHYYQVQCFVEDQTVKDVLRLKYCVVGEGENSIVLTVPKHRIESFMTIISVYKLLCTVKEVTPMKKRGKNSPHKPVKIEDSVDMGDINL